MNRRRWIGWLGWTVLAWSACAHSTIGSTNIEDTEDNREILSLVEEYRRALEALDADAVLSMVSRAYFEDNGNSDAGDDYDYSQLADHLYQDFERTRTLRVNVRVEAIEVEEDEAFAEVYYSLRAHNEYPSGAKWETAQDRTRLRFRREDGRWLIVSGL
jgi:ketosteroid isomerase-like protein